MFAKANCYNCANRVTRVIGVIPSRADGEGPHSRSRDVRARWRVRCTRCWSAVNVRRPQVSLRGPSPSARLGMTASAYRSRVSGSVLTIAPCVWTGKKFVTGSNGSCSKRRPSSRRFCRVACAITSGNGRARWLRRSIAPVAASRSAISRLCLATNSRRAPRENRARKLSAFRARDDRSLLESAPNERKLFALRRRGKPRSLAGRDEAGTPDYLCLLPLQ